MSVDYSAMVNLHQSDALVKLESVKDFLFFTAFKENDDTVPFDLDVEDRVKWK